MIIHFNRAKFIKTPEDGLKKEINNNNKLIST